MSCSHNHTRADHAEEIVGRDDFETDACDLVADILHAVARANQNEGGETPCRFLNRALRHYAAEAGVECSEVEIGPGWHPCQDECHE